MTLIVDVADLFEQESECLPTSWAKVPLGDICSVLNGFAFKSSHFNRTKGVPLIRIRDLGRPASTTYYSGDYEPEYLIRNNDLLVGMDGTFRCRKWFGGKALLNQRVCKVTPDEQFLERTWLEYGLDRALRVIQNATSSMTVKHLSSRDIRKIPFPIPPRAEQRRLVAKLEDLLSKVDACQRRLDRVPLILKRFRQSVLAAACSGRLTEDWRIANPSVESGRDLFKRLGKFLEAQPLKPKELKHIRSSIDSEAVLDALEFEEVPATWAPCDVGKVGRVCNGSTPSRKTAKYWGGDVPWVSSGEVKNNIITETRERISRQGLQESSLRLLPRGTVLIAMIGEGKTRGQSAVLEIAATINQNIAAIILDHGFVKSQFLWLWFRYQYSRTREVGSGSGPQALNCERVRELPFLLPSLPEQSEIIRRVESVFKLADQIEARHDTAKARMNQLTQSILAKAFRGELVPQDPKDEPAERLLERVRSATACPGT